MVRYVQAGLAEQQMVILAAIIRDLDRETARTETGINIEQIFKMNSKNDQYNVQQI